LLYQKTFLEETELGIAQKARGCTSKEKEVRTELVCIVQGQGEGGGVFAPQMGPPRFR